MIGPAEFAACVGRAALAPTVHNTQPARWRLDGQGAWLAADLGVALTAADPEGRDMGLSCGAVLEAMVLALADLGQVTSVADLWPQDDRRTIPGHRMVARIDWQQGEAGETLGRHLESRFTHRGLFDAKPVALFGWGRADAILLTDAPAREWLAQAQDQAGLAAMQDRRVRRELLHWLRLTPWHRRRALDGLAAPALRMRWPMGLGARAALGPLWPLLDLLRLTPALTSEAAATRSAQVVALFHRPVGESPVTSGRAYLRLWLEATALGMAGWPMAAAGDDPAMNAAICARHGIGTDRRLVQVIRFGPTAMTPPPRARRPAPEVMV